MTIIPPASHVNDYLAGELSGLVDLSCISFNSSFETAIVNGN